MLAVARVVSSAKIKGVRVTRGPEGVELGGIPDDLVHQLRNPHRMGRRAGSSQAQECGRATDGICDVVFVVRAVEVLAIPAAIDRVSVFSFWRRQTRYIRWEMNVGTDTAGAWLRRE